MSIDTQGRITLAAGMVKTLEDVVRVLALPVDEITVGSITRDERPGNPEPNFATDGAGNYWNAIGLKNDGLGYYVQTLPEMRALVHGAGRKLVVSISGDSPEENALLASRVAPYCDIIEWNTACPNAVTEGGGRKPLIGYNLSALRTHFAAMTKNVLTILTPLRIKVPPYTDVELLKEVAGFVNEIAKNVPIEGVVATNTMPNCLPYTDGEQQRISVGRAGGSGEQLHSLAVSNVGQWRSLLHPTIEVIGVGGVREAKHVKNFERVGASRVQMAGAYYHEGEKAFQHVLQGLYA